MVSPVGRWALTTGTLVATVVFTGCGLDFDLDPAPRTVYTTSPAATEIPTGPTHRYDRDAFPHWSDLDHNGCDTKQDVRERDVDEPGERVVARYRDGCVRTVTIRDPYTGELVTGGRDVHVDHVVATCDAWYSGAYAWSQVERERFANDPRNLLAVDGNSNAAKSCDGPAEWRPTLEGAWCDYATRYGEVKVAYRLEISDADLRALRELVKAC